MSSGFQTAKKSLDLSNVNLSAFNEPVASSKFFPVGTHKATIVDAEIKDYGFGDNLIVSWEGQDGEKVKQFISMFFTDKKSGERSLSNGFRLLAHSLASTVETRSEFFLNLLTKDTAMAAALKGLAGTIVVTPGRKGVDIVSEPISGGYLVLDVATKERALEPIYLSMGEAAQAIKDAGLKRAFNEISSLRNSKEEVEANEKSLRLVIETAAKSPNTSALQRANML